MTNPNKSQSEKRYSESLASLFIDREGTFKGRSCIFIKSSSDEGVIRNGGRNGARYAPQSLLSYFKKMTQGSFLGEIQFKEIEVSQAELEQKDFNEAQIEETQKIHKIIKSNNSSILCHLGGGHDHVYPLLMALGRDFKKILVLNIDAHADTRQDDLSHSGTPFRQFAKNFSGEFHILQIGLHPFANSPSTLEPLEKTSESIIWKNEIGNDLKFHQLIENMAKLVDDSTRVIFSLDADALKASDVPGVSAANNDGLDLKELRKIWKAYKEMTPHSPIIGIYELNPVFDTLSMISMRSISSFIYEVLG